jgi:hypothetical protein
MITKTFLISIVLSFIVMSGCVGVPKNQEDACSIIKQKKSWKSVLRKTEKRWGISPGFQLAFIKTESNFRPTARTQRKYFLGLIPSGRISSAYGYSQALDGTWKEYKKSTGNRYHRRSNFAHSTNFIGWYAHKTNNLLGISKNNAYLQYLAYHQGHAGFKTGAYKKKKNLLDVAKKTSYNKKKFDKQLKKCM